MIHFAFIIEDLKFEHKIGYNGPPSGTHNCDEKWPDTGCPRDSKGGCSLAIHAEQNAILYAMAERALIVFQEEKARKTKGVTSKTISDLEKVLQSRG